MSAAEYPAAIFVPADPTNYYTDAIEKVKRLIIHCTDGHSVAMNTARMWQEPRHGSSAHFVIGQDGTVIQCVSLKDGAKHAHAGNNDSSIGIEHCARTPGELGASDPGLLPSEVQYLASARLVAWLCVRFSLQPTRRYIMGHAEADPLTTHRRCPTGCGWDWDKYMAEVAGEYAAAMAG